MAANKIFLTMIIGVFFTLSIGVHAKDNNSSAHALTCDLTSGEVIVQPEGSTITACCYEADENEEAFCTICDENGEDCSKEFYSAGIQERRPSLIESLSPKREIPRFPKTSPLKQKLRTNQIQSLGQ